MNKTTVAQEAKTNSFLPPVQGLLQRKCACGNHTVAGGECAGCAKSKTGLQRKLSIGASNDPLELEADRVADQVMAAPANSAVSSVPLRIQRFSGQSSEGADIAPASVDQVLASSGRPLEPALRQDMELCFGHDFSQVRVHSDTAAEQSAREVNANAYTAGHNIVFGDGRFAPGSQDGRRLIAHELTHVLQQRTNKTFGRRIQRDLAQVPTAVVAAPPVLTATQIRSAIIYNQRDFTEVDEIKMLRDVLGVSAEPALIDDDFVNALASYQANFGLTPDGKLGRETAARLATEITSEADFMADPVRGTERRRIARRMQLRGMVSQRAGTLAHRDFVGDRDRPTGMVSARIGGDEHAAFGTPAASNVITLEYTGENSGNIRWLQFINIQMRGFQPGVAAPTFNAGSVGASGGTFNYSNATTTNWGVDSGSPTIPFYDAVGIHLNVANSSIVADQPQGWQATANAFAATLTPAANRVVLTFNFDTYAVESGTTPRYHIRWSATYEFDVTAGTESAIRYSRIGGGAIGRLAAGHRGAIDARYAGSGVL